MKLPLVSALPPFYFIMLSLSVGGGDVDTQPAASAPLKRQQKRQTNRLPGVASTDFAAKAFVVSHFWKEICFYQMCSRTSELQSCYSYLVLSDNSRFLLQWEAHWTTEFPGHILRSRGTCWDSELSHSFACATPPAPNKQSQKSHSSREASLRPWTDSLLPFSSFIYIVELSLKRQ